MNGYLTFNGREYFFTFDDFILDIVPPKALKDVTIEALDEFIKLNSNELTETILKGSTINENKKITFVLKRLIAQTLSGYTFEILAYFVSDSHDLEIDSISVYGEELNWFYNIRKAYEYSFMISSGEINLGLKSFDDLARSFNFNYKGSEVGVLLNISRNIYTMSRVPVTLDANLSLRFNPTSDIMFVLDLVNLLENFMTFVSYRRNTTINRIVLNKKNEEDMYKTIGELFINREKDVFKEDEKRIRERILDYDLLQDNCGRILQLLSDESIYMLHIPYNSRDMSFITPARFVLITAAFEWEFKHIYGNVKIKENEKFRDIKNEIIEFLDNKIDKSMGKIKDYAKKYKRIIDNSDMSLSERLLRVFKDYDSILGVFIDKLYSLNGIKDVRYSDMAERLQAHRNSYAHGNIDKELEPLVILDLITLEWTIYAMILKEVELEDKTIQKCISKLFGRNIE